MSDATHRRSEKRLAWLALGATIAASSVAHAQLGPDAERRSPFYSPEARFSLSLVGHLDAIHSRLAGTERASVVAQGRRASGESQR